jgi:hypothetical protein
MQVLSIAANNAAQRPATQHGVVDETKDIDNAILRDAENDRVSRLMHPFRWIGNLVPAVPGMVHTNSCPKRAYPLDAVTLWIVGKILHRLNKKSRIALAADFMKS